MILTKAQSQSIYNAMCELNNVSARIDASLQNCRVTEQADGSVLVFGYASPSECYSGQTAFAEAYGAL